MLELIFTAHPHPKHTTQTSSLRGSNERVVKPVKAPQRRLQFVNELAKAIFLMILSILEINWVIIFGAQTYPVLQDCTS